MTSSHALAVMQRREPKYDNGQPLPARSPSLRHDPDRIELAFRSRITKENNQDSVEALKSLTNHATNCRYCKTPPSKTVLIFVVFAGHKAGWVCKEHLKSFLL